MTNTTFHEQPHFASSKTRQRQRRQPTLGGIITSIALAALIVALVLTMPQSERFEAQLATHAVTLFLGIPAVLSPEGSQLVIGSGTHTIFTIEVGTACSVVLLVVPFILIAIAQLSSGRTSVMRALPAVLVGGALLLIINAARIMLISGMTYYGLLEGFGWAHTLYGSVLVLIGLACIIVGFIWFSAGGRAKK